MKKIWIIINIIMISLGLFVAYFLYSTSRGFEGEDLEDEINCIDVNNVASLVYDLCYDAYSKTIFIEVTRGQDSYNLKSIDLSFFDYEQINETITDYPKRDSSKYYKIAAEKNPKNLDIYLNVEDTFSVPKCSLPRSLFVKYCKLGSSKNNIEAEVKPLGKAGLSNFSLVGKSSMSGSDLLSESLVEKERIWGSVCTSDWVCSSWQGCSEEVRRRNCEDRNKCSVPTNVPQRVISCDGLCREDWVCQWSKCSKGYTIPECTDMNKCGTEFEKPEQLSCLEKGIEKKCTPFFECSDWSSCSADYGFEDLKEGFIEGLSGIQTRSCVDSLGCLDTKTERRSCLVGEDIFTSMFKRCGKEYIGIYNRLTGELVAWMDNFKGETPGVNIRFGDEVNLIYCDYCFDGKKSGDETAVDCGGSCKLCSEKY